MIKNILVPLTGFDSDVRALKASYLVGLRFGANIVGFRVRPDPMQIVIQASMGQFSSTQGNVHLIHAIEDEGKKRTLNARKAFDEFSGWVASRAAAGDKPVALSWQEVEGDPVADTIIAARYSDLIVVGRAPKDGEFSADNIANILVRCGRPLLLVPDRPLETIGSHIAIAWKETAEAARAVTGAMPLLSQAERVAVIAVNETLATSAHKTGMARRLCDQLAHHGISTEARDIALLKQNLADIVIRAAHECDADLLVMGAYSHSRLRELVLGGFTQHILRSCDMAVLLLH
ncbi:MAG TPA: universal stress protein [Micropepsaceae bacterium]|nr:universal stress protein [Micropepsaceae bacterium]